MKKLCLFLLVIVFIYLNQNIVFIDMNKYQSTTKTIEIKGAIKNPGVYEVDIHASIKEIIEKAGGINHDGDISGLNLALDVPNQSVIIVPIKQEHQLISINTASLEELDSLPGIGPAIANRIIEYRNKQPFKSIEEIMNVKGIKEKLFLKIKDLISL